MNCHNDNLYTRGDTDQLSFKSFAKFSFKKIFKLLNAAG